MTMTLEEFRNKVMEELAKTDFESVTKQAEELGLASVTINNLLTELSIKIAYYADIPIDYTARNIYEGAKSGLEEALKEIGKLKENANTLN